MHFFDFIPGDKENLILYDLEGQSYFKIVKGDVSKYFHDDFNYCYDLLKFQEFFGISRLDFFPIIYDLQSIFGLMGHKTESFDELIKNDSLLDVKKEISSHLKSYKQTKINISGFSLEQIIPDFLFQKFLKTKLSCVSEFIKTPVDSSIYDFYRNVFSLIKEVNLVSQKTIYTNEENRKKINLNFNIFGSKNSRLSIRKNNLNIYNLTKDKRDVIVAPENFNIVQFDFKSFQPRIAIALFGDQKLKEKTKNSQDIYSYFEGEREEVKLSFLSWMFSTRKNTMFEDKAGSIHSSRKKLHQESKSGKVLNVFGRPLFFNNEEENVVFQNYICSVEADCILLLIKEINSFLTTKQSYVIFPFHDCLVFYIHKDEMDLIPQIKNIMERKFLKELDFVFPVSIKIGKDFLNMHNHA